MKMSRIGIIGAAQSGKSTFLAVNYYLLQQPSDIISKYYPIGSSQYHIEPSIDYPETAKVLQKWIEDLNKGKFPNKSGWGGDMLELQFNLWCNRNKKIKISEKDPGGEIWKPFEPNNLTFRFNDAKMDGYFRNCLGYLLLIESRLGPEQDAFYKNILIYLREKYLNYGQKKTEKPIAVVITKTDEIADRSIPANVIISNFMNSMPLTKKQIQFFHKKSFSYPHFFASSIGTVETVNDEKRITEFNPRHFLEPLVLMYKLSNMFKR